MDEHRLLSLIDKPEGIKLDFKEKLHLKYDSDKKEFAKDVSAIANSKGGRGYIIYGVKDRTKEIKGVELKDFNEESLQQVISSRVEPPVPIRLEVFCVEGKNVVLLTIFNSDQKPHQLRGGGKFYIRRGSTTDFARRHEIANIMQEYGLVNIETTIMKNLTMKAFDKQKLSEFMKKNYEAMNEDEKILLTALGIIRQDVSTGIYHPTFGGLLLFGKTPQTFIPHTGVKICYDENVYYVRGTILDLINDATDIVMDLLNEKNYPKAAVEQAIANAVVHRDYWDTQRETEVKIYKDRIDVLNPGSKVELHEGEGNLFRRRNPWIYERVLVIDKKGRFLKHGKGIERIKKMFNKEVKIINDIEQNIYTIRLPR